MSIERIKDKHDIKTVLDKHLRQFSGQVKEVKTYVKDGKNIKLIKIKKKKKRE